MGHVAGGNTDSSQSLLAINQQRSIIEPLLGLGPLIESSADKHFSTRYTSLLTLHILASSRSAFTVFQMAGPQSYPSPTRAETQAGAPFYHTSNPSAADSAIPTTEVPDVSMDQGREDINVSQLERLHNEIVAQIHPDLENSASKVALAAASSAADAAASIAASDAHQQLARQVMSLGGVDVAAEAEASAHTPPFQMGDEGAMTASGGAPGVMTGSAKVRSKVSRACDECRRKKV
jgi:hypothetical protein